VAYERIAHRPEPDERPALHPGTDPQAAEKVEAAVDVLAEYGTTLGGRSSTL
jgi:hypothetical protein